MQVKRNELIYYLQHLLQLPLFQDYCPNGLQVEGKADIGKIVTGVTASQALLDAAVTAKADAILVHHGYFWKNEPAIVVGMKAKRLHTLLTNQINLFAYHLPLDAHAVYGNNIQLAEQLGFEVVDSQNVVCKGKLIHPMTGNELVKEISMKLNREPLYIPGNSPKIETIAWCTGAAQSYITNAIDAGVDAYLTGEVSESTVHTARENGLHFFAAGHHATERYGVKALGTHLAHHFGIEHEFMDIDNPV